MIPRHSISVGLGEFFSLLGSSGPPISVSAIEMRYAEVLGVTATVIVPSVRAGILLALRAVGAPGLMVVGPAYTCRSVHQAMALSGARLRLVDPDPGSFLLSPAAVRAAAEPGSALVLSELYGLPYGPEMMRDSDAGRYRLRIFDMAMSIPLPTRLNRLHPGDLALFSFGRGKPMFAGWGGVVCCQNLDLAASIREQRDRWVLPTSWALGLRHRCAAALQIGTNQRGWYGLSHHRQVYSLLSRLMARQEVPAARLDRRLPAAWRQPMTTVNLKLALYNLGKASQNAAIRRSQAALYAKSLVDAGIVQGPAGEHLPCSHFPIRVPSALRDRLCDYLRERGIDTATLFPFPPDLNRSRYPNAADVADEVLTLPLGPTTSPDEVEMISHRVKDGLLKFGAN